MRATIRTTDRTQRHADAQTVSDQVVINEEAQYVVAMSFTTPGRPTRRDSDTMPGTSARGLLRALLRGIANEVEQDGPDAFTCWTVDPSGGEQRQTFIAA